MQPPLLRAALAEGTGVFFLVLAGCGAVLSGGNLVGVALAFGLTLLVLIYALGHICGAHFNPAITVALAATGHFPWRAVPAYLASQFGGALVAALALVAVYDEVGASATALAPGLDAWRGFLVEVLATALLALAVIGVATDRRAASTFGGLAIGLAVGAGILWAGPLTGASLNPARSLGPALVSGEYGDLWLALTAPFVGALLAMIGYEALRRGEAPRQADPSTAVAPPDSPGATH